MNQIYIIAPCLFNIRFSIILQFTTIPRKLTLPVAYMN